MKYYKNANGEIYAYENDVSNELLNQRIKELGLTPLSKKELEELNKPKELAPKEIELLELEAQIKECEDDIRRALIIGNTAVLENLRSEYKELIANKEELEK